MGYRNEWQIAVIGDDDQIVELQKKIAAKYPHAMETLNHGYIGHRGNIALWSGYSKCDTNWDTMVRGIMSMCTEMRLGFAYARIGADLNDNDQFDNGLNTSQDLATVQRTISQPNGFFDV
jgi:hypothetical protein